MTKVPSLLHMNSTCWAVIHEAFKTVTQAHLIPGTSGVFSLNSPCMYVRVNWEKAPVSNPKYSMIRYNLRMERAVRS